MFVRRVLDQRLLTVLPWVCAESGHTFYHSLGEAPQDERWIERH
jgi:hypothetical protein